MKNMKKIVEIEKILKKIMKKSEYKL